MRFLLFRSRSAYGLIPLSFFLFWNTIFFREKNDFCDVIFDLPWVMAFLTRVFLPVFTLVVSGSDWSIRQKSLFFDKKSVAQDLIRYWTVKPLPRPNRALCFSMLLLEKFGRKNTKGYNSLLEYLDLLSFSLIHILSSL